MQHLIGPERVLPGRLAVSRTFGDMEAKDPDYKGNPRVVIAEPEIKEFKSHDNMLDYILMGCDGVFDYLLNPELTDCVWETVQNKAESIKQERTKSATPEVSNDRKNFLGYSSEDEEKDFVEYMRVTCESLLKASILSKSQDNLTVIVISLKGFRERLKFLSTPQSTIQFQNITE